MSTLPPPHDHGPDWIGRATAIASLLTVMVALAALLLTNNANRDQLKATQDQLRLARDQQQLAERGQITDRFTKAVDQLGSDKVDVRLGGIYALDRISRDSSGDQPAVVRVLSAFVRDNSTRPTLPSPSPPIGKLGGCRPQPPTDVQAALTVLGGRPTNVNDTGPDPRQSLLDLSGADLTCASLYRGNFAYGKLELANLTDAYLSNAKLCRATLEQAVLTDAVLQNTDLRGAILTYAHLPGARLPEANLVGADLGSADLTAAIAQDANLAGADLQFANLSGADLAHANLSGAHLLGAKTDSRTKLPPGIGVPPVTAPAPTGPPSSAAPHCT